MSTEPWHLDKRVPIALLVTIFLQTAAVVWWSAKIDARVAALEVTTIRHEGDIKGVEQVARSVNERLIRIEEQLKAQTATMERLLTHLRTPIKDSPR